MKEIMKRSLALLMALVICIGLMPNLNFVSSAAVPETSSDYQYGSWESYSNVIKNWGTRGETANSLSPNAEAFYTEGYTYDDLVNIDGGTGTSDATSSALYETLKTLMTENMTNTSYGDARYLFQFTDCQNNDSAYITCFYAGTQFASTWDNGTTYNREHTWPKSKMQTTDVGNDTVADATDLMLLRPATSNLNSSRGNKAYGVSSGYYDPNQYTTTNDIRGDVARMMLYGYVRWENADKMWGTDGVIESLDVLLEWMAADPVDTWELGRNDSVQSITGTRNVFVDYPELAFLLFGADIPADMVTPSGKAAGCGHNNFDAGVVTAPTCTAEGFTTYTCQTADCGFSYTSNFVNATGHIYVDGTCTCGAVEPKLTIAEAIALGSSKEHNTYTEEKYYVTGVITEVYNPTYGNMYITDGEGNTLTIYGSYSADGATRYDKMETKPVAGDTVKIYGIIGQYSGTPQMKNGWIVYCCKHENATVEGNVDATCTTDGNTGTSTCPDCGKVSEDEVIPATGEHTYENGVCTGCSAEEPSSGSDATYIMSDYKVDGESGGGEFVRQLDDVVTFTISSGWFTSEARIYKNANGILVFQKPISSLVINAGNKNSTFDVYVSEDGENWTLHQENVAYTKAYSDVTITFDTPVKYIKLDAPNAQLRFKTMTVTFVEEGSEPDFELTISEAIALGESKDHNTYTEEKYYVTGVITEVYQTTYGNMYITDEEGNVLTIYGTYSADGTIRYDAMETKPVPGDTVKIYGIVGQYNGNAQIKNGWIVEHTPAPCQHTNTELQNAKEATCTADGYTGDTVCTGCGVTIETGKTIYATVHSFENDVCTGCGQNRADLTLSIEEAIALGESKDHNAYTEEKYYVTGVITEVYNPTYGNMYITDSNGNVLTIYGSYSADGTTRYDKMETKPVAGDTVTVYGIIGQYSGTPQMKNGWIVEHCTHENTNIVGAVDATCTTDGYTGDTVCSDCGVTVSEGEVITAPGHTEETIPGKDATCTETGLTEGKKCSACDEILTAQEEIPMVAHALVPHDGKDATCTEDGWEAYETCENCDYTTYTVIAAGHKLVAHESKAPTCTENGWEAYEACENCDYTTYTEIAAGHKYEAVVTAPTCTEGGFTTHTCSACGDHYVSDPVDALGHDMIHYERKEPTCREKGWEEHEACSRCDLSTCVEIEVTTHEYELTECFHEGVSVVIDLLDFLLEQLEWLEDMLETP